MWRISESSLAPEVLAYYERGGEATRLRESAHGLLELWRTKDILRRELPAAPARVLDVGGGQGVHAEWLAADGHRVRLIDPVPSQVTAAARLTGVEAAVGDARRLSEPDDSADRDAILAGLRRLETEPSLLGASSHLMTLARVP